MKDGDLAPKPLKAAHVVPLGCAIDWDNRDRAPSDRWRTAILAAEVKEARLGIDLMVVADRLWLRGQVNYDLLRSELQQYRSVLEYRSQCWNVLFEYREQLTSSYESKDFRFLLALKNVGTFLDLNGGESTDHY